MKRALSLILLSIFFCGAEAGAQSALEVLQQMGNGNPVAVPPVSDPVCIYCGANRSDGPRQEPHRPGYPCYVGTGGRASQADDYVINNHHTVTYNEPETVYIPPTPIRDTPEGQMMLAAADAIGYAVGSLISEGLSAGLDWLLGKIFDPEPRVQKPAPPKHHGSEYEASDTEKNNGDWQVIRKGKSEGLWNKRTQSWLIKPGDYKNIFISNLYGVILQDKKGKWGMINMMADERSVLVPFEYDDCKFVLGAGPGSPDTFGYKDTKRNMHYLIGRCKKPARGVKTTFRFYDGVYSNVEYTGCADNSGEDRFKVMMIATNYYTGKTKVIDYWGWVCVGDPEHHVIGVGLEEGQEPERVFDEVILTGIRTPNAFGGWNDYYKVKNHGKWGYVKVMHDRISEGNYRFPNFTTESLLPCKFDEITPLPLQLTTYDEIDSDSALVEKDGKYGIGFWAHPDVQNPRYATIGITSVTSPSDNKVHHVAILTGGETGQWEVYRLTGGAVRWLDGTPVTGPDFPGAIEAVREHMAAIPSQWDRKKIIY